MENVNKDSIVIRLVVCVVSLVLALISTVLFAFGFFPSFASILPYAVALGLILTVADYASILSVRSRSLSTYCDRSLGIISQIASILLLILALGDIAVGTLTTGIAGVLYVLAFELAFWHAIIGFVAFEACLLRRDC